MHSCTLQSATGHSGDSTTPGHFRGAGDTHCHRVNKKRGIQNSLHVNSLISSCLFHPSQQKMPVYICTRVYFIHECAKPIYTHNIYIYTHCTLMHNGALQQMEITARKRKNFHKTPLSSRSPSDLGDLDK